MNAEPPRFPLCFLDRLRMGTDGKGITALVGAYGCPLACRMCLNPQTWRKDTRFEWVTPADLYDRVKQDNLYYLATGGGITFGGGEPLTHTDFIRAFREICPADWHLYAETSLHVPPENVRTAAACIDRFFVDIKDTDPAVYRTYTGQDNELTLQNLSLLLSLAGAERITVRVPLIPGYNTEEARARSLELLARMGVTHTDCFTYRVPQNNPANAK